jgi:hypothetical protein
MNAQKPKLCITLAAVYLISELASLQPYLLDPIMPSSPTRIFQNIPIACQKVDVKYAKKRSEKKL